MKKKILIIEKEPFIALLTDMRLAPTRFETITAGDGIEGLEKVDAQKPDVILLDVVLPRMDGFHFVQELRRRSDETRLIPVLVFSARSAMKDLFRPQDIQGFFLKPFNTFELLEKIEAVIREREQQFNTVPRALLVGFDWDAMRPIRGICEREGFAVLSARDAHKALEVAVRESPKVIFVSSLLAGMDVWEFCSMMQDLPATRNIPMVVYDLGDLGEEGTRQIKAAKVIVYTDHRDLEVQTEKYLKENF